MRDIKFRAYVKFLGETQGVTEWKANGNIFVDDYFYALASDDVVLMQYTGLKDKNGVEIYEGDIFFDGIENCTIEWCDESASFVANDGTEKHDLGGWTNHEVIIGNIHQNPKLLEGKK